MIQLVNDVKDANFITHNRRFHIDDVLSTIILELVFGVIYLARVDNFYEKSTTDKFIYDLNGFNTIPFKSVTTIKYRKNGVIYSSAGYIWSKYGKEVPMIKDNPKVEEIVDIVDKRFIQGVDANAEQKIPKSDYPAYMQTLTDIVAGFNPVGKSTDEEYNERFLKACETIRTIFINEIEKAIGAAKQSDVYKEALLESKDGLAILNEVVPWDGIFYNEERFSEILNKLYYIVYPTTQGSFEVRAIPLYYHGIRPKRAFPEDWRESSDLYNIFNDSDVISCNKTGTVIRTSTKEAAVKVAEKALSYE
jgi:uncharacterized UPF0160 family protein